MVFFLFICCHDKCWTVNVRKEKNLDIIIIIIINNVCLSPSSFIYVHIWQANLSNANLEGALATGNTSFKGTDITGAGTYNATQ